MNDNIKIQFETIVKDAYSLTLENQELIEALNFIMSDPEDLVRKFHHQEYPIIFSASRLIKLIKLNNEALLKLTVS